MMIQWEVIKLGSGSGDEHRIVRPLMLLTHWYRCTYMGVHFHSLSHAQFLNHN